MSEDKSKIVHPASKEEFSKLIKGKKPVLVDFSAEWCGPCQMMGPVLDQMSEEYEKIDQVVIAKVDIDALRDVALEYNVMSVPTFMIFKDGKPVETMVGMRPEEELVKKLDELIEK